MRARVSRPEDCGPVSGAERVEWHCVAYHIPVSWWREGREASTVCSSCTNRINCDRSRLRFTRVMRDGLKEARQWTPNGPQDKPP